jgi:hypothetical protein
MAGAKSVYLRLLAKNNAKYNRDRVKFVLGIRWCSVKHIKDILFSIQSRVRFGSTSSEVFSVPENEDESAEAKIAFATPQL